jgi:adenylate cyclase
MDEISLLVNDVDAGACVHQVTVLFVDLAGFTALSEQLSPPELMTLVNSCFDHVAPVITLYDGQLNRYEGDRLLTVFRGRTARGHHSKRALSAAQAVQEEIERFNQTIAEDLPTAIQLHMGINTGLAATGMMGAAGFQVPTVMGYSVNLAARLADESSPGETLVGEMTYLLTHTSFDLRSMPPMRLRGVKNAVRAYRLCYPQVEGSAETRCKETLQLPLSYDFGILRRAHQLA